jgi:hypothetical protein
MLAGDERSLQTDLVRGDRIVPVTGCVGSRDSCSSAPAQRATPQVPETVGVRLCRPPGICWSYRLSLGALNALTILKPETVIRRHRAGFRAHWRWKSRPRGGRPTTSSRRPPAHMRYEHRESTLGRSSCRPRWVLAMVLFVIIAMDRPFVGDMRITAESYQLVYDLHMRR